MDAADARQKPGQIVFTNKARCRDCYRCLRACPVKAIRVVGGQAFVDADRCIACGTCIRECPQEAKTFRNDVERASRLLASSGMCAATVAPSFAAFFRPEYHKRLPEALRRLGFKHVGETAVGAWHTARATARCAKESPHLSHICTACPAVVNYVEQYEPDLTPRLTPALSPMLAHGKALKERFGRAAKVVFVGPCVAKKSEVENAVNAGFVDCALTFRELLEWLQREGVYLDECPDSDFDEQPSGESRYFPVPGGLARTAALDTDLLGTRCLAASGIHEVREALDSIRAGGSPVLLEPLFCPQGCVNGPGIPPDESMYTRRMELLHYAEAHPGAVTSPEDVAVDVTARYVSRRTVFPAFTEEQIRAIYGQTGKSAEEDQLNCGACGYDTCKDQAIAVLQGMAVPEMCIPHMRRLAEQRSDKIIETTPNGIIILNQRLEALHMNPAFRRMFQATDGVLGKHISYLMDAEPFERLRASGKPTLELTATHERYSLVCHQIIYPLPEEQQVVGIFVNITNSMISQEKLKRLRSDTIRKAQELMEHQIKAAQEMAQFLGETTARGEELVRNILSMATEKQPGNTEGGPWDTGTLT